MMNEPLSAIMTTDIVTVSPDDNLDAVKEILFTQRIHHVPVVDGPKLVGIITSYDIMKLNMKFEDYSSTRVRDVMTTKVVTLEPHEKIGAASQVFLRHLFHGIPIVDDAGNLAGIVTTHDIMKYQFDREYPNDELEKAYRQSSQKV